MSSILKALKRLEEEKAERSDASVDIARDILRQSRPRRRTLPRWLLPAASGAAISAGIAAVLLFHSAADNKTPAVAPLVVSAAASQERRPPAPPPPDMTSNTSRPAPADPEVVEVRMPQPPAVAKEAPAVAKEAPAVAKEAPAVAKEAPAVADREPSAPPAVTQRQAQAVKKAETAEAALPKLSVSGIAYRTEREERLAVVNDLPVMEGTVVEGARVEEILADRVRFSAAGRAFEVRLDAGL